VPPVAAALPARRHLGNFLANPASGFYGSERPVTPVDVAVLKKEAGGIRASFVSEDELEEHLGSVADADRHFGTWKAAAEKETVAEVPSPPSSTSGKGQGG